MAVVYFHRRKDTNEVFYVGIGKTRARAKSTKSRSKFWWNIIKKVGYDIDVVHTKLSWDEAVDYEIKYIKEFGRRDLGLGNLVNMTDGGDGGKGVIQSEESNRKRSVAMKGKKNTKSHNKKIGLSKQGEKSTCSILTEKDVRNIIKEYSETNITQKELGKKYGVFPQYISKIITGKVWKHLGLKVERNNYSKIITKEDVLEMRRLYDLGNMSHREIAEKFGMKRRTTTNIINRKSWKHI